MIQRVRKFLTTILAGLKGKSPERAENREIETSNQVAPTKRYVVVSSKENSSGFNAYLRTESELVPLRPGFLVGRGSSCQLQLQDPKASRVHASFAKTDSGWVLQDNASKNGTLVNGRRVHRVLLKPGDTIQIGETVLTYEER